MEKQKEHNNLFFSLLGREMSSVEFLMDYLQLRFDGITFTLFNYPTLIVSDKQYNITSLGYRDYLCSLINSKVIDIKIIEQENMRIFFSNKIVLLVSLQDDAYKGPEIATLITEANEIQVW